MRLTWRRADGAVCPRVENGTDIHYIAGEFTQKVYDKLCEYEDAEEQGLLVRLDERLALAMLAGARAIEQNPRKYFGTTFVHDVFGDNPKEISYYDAPRRSRSRAGKKSIEKEN